MKAYFNYLIKTKWLQTIVMTIIPTLIFVLVIALSRQSYLHPGGYINHNDFSVSVVFIMIVLHVIVVFRFASLRNPKEVDLYYALPISRKRLYLTHLLFGFVQLLFVWTIMFLLGLATFVIMSKGFYNEGFLLLLYFVIIFYLAIIYSIISFVFLKANTIFDGITFIILFHILFLFMSLFLESGGYITRFAVNPFYSTQKFTAFFLSLTTPAPSGYIYDQFIKSIPLIIYNTLFFMGFSIFSFFYDYKNIEKEKTEKIGQISDNKFGYRLYIPTIIVFAIASIFFVGTVVTYLLIAIFMSAGFIGIFIFRRTAKIKLFDLGYVLIPTIIGIILGLIIN